MPIPKPGQKTIPLKDWRRFLRVADWFERTVEQGSGTRQSSYGQSLIVKTPVAGIDARDGTTISSATCIKCVAAETSTPGERTLHETDEALVVYNAEEYDVPGEIFVKTTLSPKGTRYVDRGGGQPHRISGVTSAAVESSDSTFTLSGTPAIMNPVGAISEDDYTEADLIHNVFDLTFASGQVIHAEWNDTAEQWEAVDPGTHVAKWLIGTASSDFLTGGAISINSSPTYKDGEAPASDPATVANPCARTGNSGATVVALHDGDGTYTAIDVSHVAETFVTEITVNGTTFKLQDKTRASSIMPRGAESGLNDIHTGTDCP